MKKHFIIFLLLILPVIVLCQDTNKVINIVKSNTVRIGVTFTPIHGGIPKRYGSGVLINGKYVLTCYHLLISGIDPKNKITSIYIFYNRRLINNKYIYDSLLVSKDFKANKGQYDFSKHIYDPNNYNRDVIVFKLKSKLKFIPYEISKTVFHVYDSCFLIGNVLNEKKTSVHEKIAIEKFVLYKTNSQITQDYFIGLIGPLGEGSSGAPVFNIKGELIGMIDHGNNNLPLDDLNTWLKQGLKPHIYNTIVDSYRQGYKLSYAFNIDYLIKTYLKGYL